MQRVREQVQVPEQLHSGAGRVKSVTVAVLDTGIAYHPDLVGRLLAFSDFVEGRNFPYDDNGQDTCLRDCMRKRRTVRRKISRNGTGDKACGGKRAGQTGGGLL